MEKLLNEENNWDNQAEVEANEGAMEAITEEEVRWAVKQMKTGKACGISEVGIELIVGSGDVGVKVLLDICNGIVSGQDMPDDWKESLLVPLYKGKGDVRECGSYRGIKLLEHGMKILERILERRLRREIVI